MESILSPKGHVEGAQLRNLQTKETREIAVDGVFVAIGHDPNTTVFKGKLEMDSNGYLLAKHGTPHWAATETSPTSVNGKTLNPETFLAWHFNHGATVMVINTGDTSAGGQVIARDIWAPRSIKAARVR